MPSATPAPNELSPEQKRALWRWRNRKYPWITPEQMATQVDLCLGHHGANGNKGKIKDWVRACMNWVTNSVEVHHSLRAPSSSPAAMTSQRERAAEARRARQADDRAKEQQMRRLGADDFAGFAALREQAGLGDAKRREG